MFAIGASNSSQYARVDMLALQLQQKLPHFQVVRITKTPHEWQVCSVRICWLYSLSLNIDEHFIICNTCIFVANKSNKGVMCSIVLLS